MDEPNRILAGRYEIGDVIGRGGMAEVHIGHDRRLSRTVAIKVLRSDLARDPAFQNRFRREAQAAAALNHPAIVAVYDTGEEITAESTGAQRHVPFIVMEYVEGHTVRDIQRTGTAVPIDEALDITIGVLSALEYSHHAGIVHRDIKPANVMITPTGAIKVMDFGIARALADSAMTQTQAVVGTAQYLSPEQARGEQVDTRSDLYSTGCLLFELITGRPPFMADSPVAIAYQHVREEPPLPSSLSADVPESLDRVVLKALAKDRELRYQTAAEFRADLEAAQRGGRVLAPPVGATVPAAFANGAATTQLMAPASPATQVMAPTRSPWGSTGLPSEAAPEPAEPKNRRWLLISLIVVGLLAVIAIVWMMLSQSAGSAPVLVPDVANKTVAEAESILKKDGFKPERAEEASATVPKDQVTRTSPAAGKPAQRNATVTYYVSTGPATAQVPDVSGKTPEQAVTLLAAAKLKVSENRAPDDSPAFPAGQVTKTDPPAHSPVAEGSTVTLYVSTGRVQVTNVVGKSQADAVAELQGLKLLPVVQNQESTTVPAGSVISTAPVAGTLLDQGKSITVVVATAPAQAVVPDGLVGLNYSDAVTRLTAAKLTNVKRVDAPSAQPVGTVVSVNPISGTTVPLTQQIVVTVSAEPTPSPTTTTKIIPPPKP